MMRNMFNPHNQVSFRRLVSCIVMCAVCCTAVCAKTKPLSDKDRTKFAEIARNHYAATMMDGASVYRFKGREILLVIVEVKKSPNAQRVGQVKASRSAGEFLQSATNKSVTVYAVSEGNSYSFKDKGEESSSTSGTNVSDRITQGTSDLKTTETEETFSDKIVQNSLTRVGHIEPLCRLGAEGGNVTFAYFMILEK